MITMNQEILDAWEERRLPAILTTVDRHGMPNAIYASSVQRFGEDKIVIADNYFDKTRANLLDGTKGAILFRTKAGKPYQLKGSMQYLTEGEIFADMKRWNPAKHPGHAAAVLIVEAAYSGAEKIC